MVLNELGSSLTKALSNIGQATVIDNAVLDTFLKEICTALLQADVNVRQVSGLRVGVKNRVNLEQVSWVRGLGEAACMHGGAACAAGAVMRRLGGGSSAWGSMHARTHAHTHACMQRVHAWPLFTHACMHACVQHVMHLCSCLSPRKSPVTSPHNTP